MTATEGFEIIRQLIEKGCENVVVCNGSHCYAIEYGGVRCNGSHLLALERELRAEVGQLCAEYKTVSTVVLKVVITPMISDMLVMSINRHDKTIVINVKERADE